MRVLCVLLCASPLRALHRVDESLQGGSPPEERASPNPDPYDHLSAEGAARAVHLAREHKGVREERDQYPWPSKVRLQQDHNNPTSWLPLAPCDYGSSKLVVWWRQGVFQDRKHRDVGYPDCDVTCVEAGSQEECGGRADAIVYHLPTANAIRRLDSGDTADAMEGAKPEFGGVFSIGMMMESTKNYPKYSLENITRLGYDMAATTSLASDLPVFYMNDVYKFNEWGKQSVPGFHDRLPAVAFLARKCGERGDLVSRLAELGVPVHSLGKCAPKRTTNKFTHEIATGDKVSVISKYRVYLAFENSIEPGYVTEKVYDGFKAGCVGVYSGAPDIQRFVPPGSLIEISKETVVDAAANIKEALRSEDAWNRLNWWRQVPVSEWQGGSFLRSWGAPGETPPAGFHADLGCRICRAAYAHKHPEETRFDPKTQTLERLAPGA